MFNKNTILRLIAYIIDYILIFVIAGILNYLFGFGTFTRESYLFNLSLESYEFIIVSLLYYMPFAYFNRGKTVGKLVTRLEIKYSDLTELDQRSLLVREFIKSLLNIIGIISFIFVLLRKDQKSIHDILVKTIVVKSTHKKEKF